MGGGGGSVGGGRGGLRGVGAGGGAAMSRHTTYVFCSRASNSFLGQSQSEIVTYSGAKN